MIQKQLDECEAKWLEAAEEKEKVLRELDELIG